MSLEHFAPDGRGFLFRHGPAKKRGEKPCQLKLCFTSVRLEPMADVLYELSQRDDCHYVKLDAEVGEHGMVRGRCFLTTREAVVELWNRYKVTETLLCTMQDDDFANAHRPK